MKKISCVIVILITFIMSCRPSEIDDPRAYFRYLSDPSNGLLKEKSVAGIRYRIKYLPPDYTVYNLSREKGYTPAAKDSLRRIYSNSLTFLINIGPAEGEDFDITRLGVSNYKEFADRIEKMAFNAQEWMRLSSDNKEYRPQIVRLENINAQDNSRNFVAVFSSGNGSGDLKANDLCFSYDDELFNTGINKFVFRARDIAALPDFKF